VLLREEEAYAAQGLAWDFPTKKRLPDVELSLELIGGKMGLMALLDEQSKLGAIGSDMGTSTRQGALRSTSRKRCIHVQHGLHARSAEPV
jgi:hypothetical protein